MTDQVRRDESAESELLDTLLDAADAPADQPAAATPDTTAEAAVQPTPEQAAAGEAVAPPAGTDEPAPVAEETAEPVDAEAAEPETAEETTELPTEPEPVAAVEPTSSVETELPTEPEPVAAVEPTSSVETEAAAEPVAAEAAVEPTSSVETEAAAEPVAAEAAVEPTSSVETEAAAEPVAAEAAVEPTASVAGEEAGEATTAEAESGGASFTPVADEGGSRPRKLKDLQAGMELEGRVTSIALYGVFVDIGVGRDGLVHISEMSDTRIDTPSDMVAIGDTVKVKIKSVDPDARRISLTMRTGGGERSEGSSRNRGSRPKRAEVDRDRLGSLKVGDVVDGVITGFAPFGAFADIGVGKDGLIHVSELAEGRVEKAEDAVKVGDRFTFKVLEVDPEGTRISLSLRRAQRSQKMQQLETGQVLEGTVSGIAPFGAFVDIGVGRDGLVHISALSSSRVNRVEDVAKVGDKVTVKVLEVDQQSKRISLTMRLDDEQGGAPDEEDYTSGATSAPRPTPAASARFASAAEARAGRDRDRERRERRERDRRNAPAQPESYSTEDVEEEFVGDATLEDLMAKFGGQASGKRDRKDARREGEFEDEEARDERRQRDAIRRTLQQVGRDE